MISSRFFALAGSIALVGCVAAADPPHGASIANLDSTPPAPADPVEPQSVRELRESRERLRDAVAAIKRRGVAPVPVTVTRTR